MRPAASRNAGVSSDDTSATFSISSSDKARDIGTAVVGIGLCANDSGTNDAAESPMSQKDATAYALPARQKSADSEQERGMITVGPQRSPSEPGSTRTRGRGRHGPRRVGSDDSENDAREKSRSPARAGEIAIRYSSRGTPRTRADAKAMMGRVLSGGSLLSSEGMGIRAIRAGSAPSLPVLVPSPRPPKSQRSPRETPPPGGPPG